MAWGDADNGVATRAHSRKKAGAKARRGNLAKENITLSFQLKKVRPCDR
jgi:hypothetical protein